MIHNRKQQQGFTAVELIVALVVGVLLLGSAYQLYSSVAASAGDSQRQAQASNSAYLLMRKYQADITYIQDPCVSKPATTVAMPASSTLPDASATVAVSCPAVSTEADVSKISVTVTYNNNNSEEFVTRAIFTKAP